MTDKNDSIHVEQARILLHEAWPGDQYILKVQAPNCAADAQPGSFAHIQCDPLLPLRRPISIMRAHPQTGEVEFLYKAIGQGTKLLTQKSVGDSLNILGPIGKPFTVDPAITHPLLIGGGVGMPPMIFLAEHLKQKTKLEPLVILGSEVPFPFTPRPSTILMKALPPAVTAAMPLLEDWNIPSRLASLQGYPGCHEGYVTDLARQWLATLAPQTLKTVGIYACGPTPMLKAVTQVARDFGLPAQLSLEEFMACGVGGCAGCTVPIQTQNGPAMKRVCVDGPVFDASEVLFS